MSHSNIISWEKIPDPQYWKPLTQSQSLCLNYKSLSFAEPYEFLVKLRNITWETNYVIVSQNAALALYYPYIIPTILYDSAEESDYKSLTLFKSESITSKHF
jgi:hypothetical protein